MILIPYSIEDQYGTVVSLQSTDYETSFPRAQSLLQMETNPSYIKRAGAYPVFSGKDFSPVVLTLEVLCKHDFMTQFESLNKTFDTKDETPRQFICSNNSTTDYWYIYVTPKKVQGGHDGNMAVVTLAVDDPAIWQSYTQSTVTFSTTDSTDSTSVSVSGNDYAFPILEITPTSQPTTDYLYNMYVQVLPRASYASPNRFLDITGSWDTAALVSGGKMQSGGDDLRVFRDGIEVDRWLDGMNSTDTHVIVACDMPKASNMTLKTAIPSTGSTPEIDLNYTTANKNLITALPKTGRVVIDSTFGSTDTEEFIYTLKTITSTKLSFTTSKRGARNTTAVAHSANSFVRFLPYDFNIIYGNSAASAPTVDDTKKPIQALTSRNNSYVYTNFYDLSATRPGEWKPKTRKVSNTSLSRSEFYTSTDDEGDTDPATAMGLAAYTYQQLGAWKADTITLAWQNYFPEEIASISSVSGAQYQTGSYKPTTCSMQYSATSTTYKTAWSVPAISATDYGTWKTWSKASTDAVIPSGQYYLQWILAGTQSGSTDVTSKREISGITVGLTNYPHVMQRSEINNYRLDCTIENTTTGESLRVVYPMEVNQTIIIDTDPNFPTAKYNGALVNGAVSLSTKRAMWLKLIPGANTITYVTNMAATSGISIVIKWRNRFNFF